MAHRRVYWRVLVNVVMNVLMQEEMENFLISRVIVTFASTNLFRRVSFTNVPKRTTTETEAYAFSFTLRCRLGVLWRRRTDGSGGWVYYVTRGDALRCCQ